MKKAHPIYDNDVDTGVYQSIGLIPNDSYVQQRFICIEDVLDGFYLKTDVVGDCDAVTLVLSVFDVVTLQHHLQAAKLDSNPKNLRDLNS